MVSEYGSRAAATPPYRVIIRPDPDEVLRDWTFSASHPSWRTRARRNAARLNRGNAPAHTVLRPAMPADRWNCLFLFAPHGSLDGDQLQILARMRALAGRLMVIVAGEKVPTAVDRTADALIGKDLGGFDFSAYALALETIARHSPGAFAYMQNDSVFGPFAALEPCLERMTWDLSGFIGSAAVENHFSSFAFAMRNVTEQRLASLSPAISSRFAYDRYQDVVTMQETQLARLASRRLEVGSLWFLRGRPVAPAFGRRLAMILGMQHKSVIDLRGDATLALPIELIDQGFPFAKRSLLGKFSGLVDARALRERLAREGWDTGRYKP